ncbi:uncharacterized protein LOC110619606 [Manihot esculenta]|uniref:uncharacterized protein LOC110619606 n=1 Tax=Manihot esculenta TaxID=3983 RepID=UPI000B5D67E0|nr:uncharacterized protein LOC110619606 [Manihot esculenta]
MAAYDGTGNPQEHILNYKTFMELQTHSDALMCKVFPTTLTGPARVWFNSLEAGNIKGFTDLANIFISGFIAGVLAERKTSYLETVRQRRNESLREYVAKFNSETLQIPELDKARLPITLAELMKRIEKYIRQDDALTTSRFAREIGDRGKAVEDRRPERQERRQNREPKMHKQSWERKKQSLYQPRSLSCYQLINEIERLIKRGHLKNFVKKSEGERPQQNAVAERPHRQEARAVNDGSSGTINMIVRGTGGWMSMRGKKRNKSREGSSNEVMQIVEHSSLTISFSPEDAHGVQMPHDNALIIEAVIHNFRVRKVLVDDGSKVNLLPYRVFQQMNISEKQLVRDQASVKGIERHK